MSSPGSRRGYFDAAVLVLPLALGFANIAYGSYAIIGVLLWFGFPRLPRIIRADTLEILVTISALFVLASPYWHGPPSDAARSAALGAALGVAYFLPVKWVIGADPARLVQLARVLVWLGTGLSVVTLAGGVATQVDGTVATRLSVDFANANYAAAALATTASVTILFAAGHVPGARRRLIYLAALCVQAFTVYQLGSRAALAGVVLAALVATLLAHRPRVAHRSVSVVLIGAFIAGWLPKQFAEVLAFAAEPLTRFNSLGRSQTTLLDASGRMQLWESTIQGIEKSPVIGWGPGQYAELFNVAAIPSHAWGLEYVASVGLFGTVFVTAVIWLAYIRLGRRGAARPSPRGWLWTAVTAVALVPSLALSTHQWNAWAWLVFALWASVHALDSGDRFPSLGEREEPVTVRRPTGTRTRTPQTLRR